MVGTIQRENKKRRPKKGQKMHDLLELIKKERVSPSCGRRQFHPQPL
jgi:hypothetical protein